jgi:pimeloyl-ACP methyl ester carboxylesterase
MATVAAASGTALLAPVRGLAQAGAGLSSATAAARTSQATESGYVPVNGLEVYYEIHGSGEPLVLLHGAFGAIDVWGSILTILAETHRVIVVEFQGHGHTADIDRPFSIEDWADDVAGVMDHLDIVRADIVGYSMGGMTGLQLAIRHPELVRKLVAVSANYRTDGYYPELLVALEYMTPEIFVGTPEEAAYLSHAPNPEDFPLLVEKHKAFDANGFAWPEEDVASITAPTLLIFADSDIVRPEHAVEMFRLLGGGVPGGLSADPAPTAQLAFLPGTNHGTIVLAPAEPLLAMIETFLAAPMPAGA